MGSIELPKLGRQITEISTGENKQHLERDVLGYKISIHIKSNTMKIYKPQRSEQPILVDSNGEIDHQNAYVIPKDIDHFRKVLEIHRMPEKMLDYPNKSQLEI